jgi:hypothetical protein
MPIAEMVRKLFLCGLLVISMLVAALNLSGFMANAYIGFSKNQIGFSDSREAVRQAAQLAQKLDFRNPEAVRLLAEDDLYAGHQEQALSEYQHALQLAPADAFLWRDYAVARIRLGLIDAELEKAVIQAQSLAPKSKPLQFSLAMAGLKVYAQSNPALQSRWLKSIRFAYYIQPKGLIFSAYVAGQDLMLCQQVIPNSGINPWCVQARWRHGLCQSPRHPESCKTSNSRATQ